MSIKIERLNNSFKKAITDILYNDIRDKNIDFVTITEVRITYDLSYAKVYFTCLDDDKEKVCKSLNKVSSFIRSSLCEKVKIRKMPEINFVYDESVEYGKKIDDIIGRINNEE